MAPRMKYVRTWCKTCQDWTLHRSSADNEMDSVCKKCETVFTEVAFADIPEDKILEQRKRYTSSILNKGHRDFDAYLGYIMPSVSSIAHPFMSMDEAYAPIIIEEDAGQKAIDDAAHKIQAAKMQKAAEERERLREESQRFKMLGRNDKCLCGSGKKYKNCCLKKYENI